ncbi:hypothetical protein DVH24_038024 [Malus domestica]|uniref:Uncharacterized protein n=1 Tax=Malus domestica TaxID=3750 RepID=A0A498K6C0_MALDO|nr:hypothetical protein DVH24_038024 [Malus domestica]
MCFKDDLCSNFESYGCGGLPNTYVVTSRAQLRHSTILSALDPDHVLMVLFLGTHTRTSQWITNPEIALVRTCSWNCSRANLLNFGVPMEPEVSELPKDLGPELPKDLVLGRGGNIHIRLIGSTPLGDVGCHNPTPLRGPTYLSAHFRPGIGSDTKLSHPAQAPTTSRARLRHSTILSALGPDHALTVLFLRTHTRNSQWVTHLGIALMRTRLISEFRWNPKPVSSQKASY